MTSTTAAEIRVSSHVCRRIREKAAPVFCT